MNDTLEKPTIEAVQKSDLDQLLQRIRTRRAREGKTAPKAALYAMLEEIEHKAYYGYRRSWEILIELMADHLGIIAEPWKYAFPGKVRYDNMIKQGWIKQIHTKYPELLKHFEQTSMMEEYIAAAQRDPWDHLGDIFTEQGLAGRHNRLGQLLTPKQIVDFMIKMTYTDKTRGNAFGRPDQKTQNWLDVEALAYEPQEWQRLRCIINVPSVSAKYVPQVRTQLDPAVGTGRFLIEGSLLNPQLPLVLFGVEIDVTLYRACLVNMALFSKHPYSIVCANALMLDVDKSGPASGLWDRGNLWEPIDVSMFYAKPPPVTPKSFSLKGWQEEQAKQRTTP